MVIRTSLTAEICFLFMLNVGQWLVLFDANALTVFAILIAVRAFVLFLNLYDARRERD